MASEDAKNVAKEVLEKLGKGKKVILGEIMKKNGYAQNTADNPLNVTETKSFQGVVAPVVERWKRERDRIMQAMENKDLNKERYKTLVNSVDTLTKNIQLLSGGDTEQVRIVGVNLYVRK